MKFFKELIKLQFIKVRFNRVIIFLFVAFGVVACLYGSSNLETFNIPENKALNKLNIGIDEISDHRGLKKNMEKSGKSLDRLRKNASVTFTKFLKLMEDKNIDKELMERVIKQERDRQHAISHRRLCEKDEHCFKNLIDKK